MTKRAAQWSAVLLIGAVLVAFIWVALKGGQYTVARCDFHTQVCTKL
jgi:hypothetical protein